MSPNTRRRRLSALLFTVFAAVGGLVAGGENPAFQDWKRFLENNPLGVMTTVDDGQPRTRIFQFLWTDGDKVYFSTGAGKDVAKQIRENPRVSFCVWNADPKSPFVLSVDGPVVFDAEPALKRRALDEHPNLRGIYKSADNPEFAIFHIEPAAIYTFSFAGGKQYVKR